MPEAANIYYTDEGEGFPVVLIHGFCETHAIWNSFQENLSREFRLLTIDLPGFGQSKLLEPPFTISQVATAVLKWLDAIGISSCIIIGHSLGGYVTLAMAGQQPNRLKAFGLFHSTAYADSEEKKLSRNKVIEFVHAYGVAPFIESFIPPLFYNQQNPHIPAVIALALQTPQETLVSYVAAMRDRPDSIAVLRHYNNPVMLLAGDKDTVVSAEALETQSKLTSNPTFITLQNVAHMGMFEQEAVATGYVLDFLQQATRS
jgi:pimeloyl-ACP methyl ester carboxylesterase